MSPVGDMPKVSVVIRCYNDAKVLPAAFDSVFGQDYPSLEVIVLDDGSEDDSVAVARARKGVRVVCAPHGGLQAARREGLREARGEYVIFHDSDDLWTARDFVGEGVRLCEREGVPLYFSNFEVRGEGGVAKRSAFEQSEVLQAAVGSQAPVRMSEADTRRAFIDGMPAPSTGFLFRATAVAHDWRGTAVHADDWMMVLGGVVREPMGSVADGRRRWCKRQHARNTADGVRDLEAFCAARTHDRLLMLDNYGGVLTAAERRVMRAEVARLHFELGHRMARAGRTVAALQSYARSLAFEPRAEALAGLIKAPLRSALSRASARAKRS